MTTVLAIDQGTTATKAVVIGTAGKVLAHATEKVVTTTLPGGGVEQDPEEIYRGMLVAGAKAVAQSGRRIDALALATQGESVMAFDPATGTPLSPLVTWQDRRAEQVCRRLDQHAEEIVAATGLRLSSYFTAPKLAWLREHVTGEGVVSTIDAWLLHRLTGQFATDAATASRSLLVDLDSGAWNARLLELFGLDRERLPRIVGNDEVVGETSVFGDRVPVAGVILDQPAALLAQRCLRAGQVKVTYGTGAFLLANLGPLPPARPARATCSTAWQIEQARTFCSDGQVFAAATALSWLVKVGVLERVENLDASCAANPGGAVFVPSFDEDSGARIAGLELGTRRDQVVAAAVYGIAASVAELYDQAGARVEVLLADGGLTNSTCLLQAQANLLQIPVRAYTGAHATAQGAAALARLALDRATTIELELAGDRLGKPVLPKWAPEQAEHYRARWREVAGRAQPDPVLCGV
ncbi:FGGY family carbohydrate kinase [Actinospica robiniae]|uniref:FGGY family carbohydrate kinase n=1 Tax=Actinospica robiniae TaxID=304901 RepID=UPI0004250D43|nr:FGGY family carbohydrate kinase [Actinospica robiniae]